MKQDMKKKKIYEKPLAELWSLPLPLSYLVTFSSTGGDWNNGGKVDGELDEAIEFGDWDWEGPIEGY